MKKFFAIYLMVCMLATVALAGIRLYPTNRFEFTNCASGGSAAQTVKVGTYFTRILAEDVWMCYAATCVSGGEQIGAGTVFMLTIPAAQSVSCRSAGSTGDLILTRADQ